MLARAVRRTAPRPDVVCGRWSSRCRSTRWPARARRRGLPVTLAGWGTGPETSYAVTSVLRVCWIGPASPRLQLTATSAQVFVRIEAMRRERKWSARRMAHDLAGDGVTVSVRTVSRHLVHLGPNRRRFSDPTGETNRQPRRIHTRWPGHMVHIDVKKVGVIPDGDGWRGRGRGRHQVKLSGRGRKRGAKAPFPPDYPPRAVKAWEYHASP